MIHPETKKRVVFISSTGGHLNELLQFKPLFPYYQTSIITEDGQATEYLKQVYPGQVHYLRAGSRNQPLTYPLKFLYNALLSLIYVLRLRPQFIVSTGTHTAVVFCYLGKLLGAKIIYIETYANVEKANLTGKLIHPISDLYLVQWESLLKAYPKAKYVGKVY